MILCFWKNWDATSVATNARHWNYEFQLNRHEFAVNDAKEALKLDSEYSKAFARMGFAYLSLNQLQEAEDCYLNALRLDANNQSYKDNLDAVREKINAGPLNPQGS